MLHKTYMELVNEAIAEAKVTLDPLTSTTFANPPRTTMYYHFKRWVNRAYKSILQKRNEWFFRSERATVTIYPRLQLRMTGATVLAVNDQLRGQSSSSVFTILAIHATEDVETDATVEYTVSVSYSDVNGANNLVLNELFNRTAPTVVNSIGRIKGRGRYSFSELVPSVDEVDVHTFTIQPSIVTDPTGKASELSSIPALTYKPWSGWSQTYDQFNTSVGTPAIVTRTDDGLWDFYPRPNEAYDVSFDYSQDVALMVLYNDTPKLLHPKFDDLIMWKALAEYADFDERPKVYARAKKGIAEFEFLMGRDALPEVIVNLSRFDN